MRRRNRPQVRDELAELLSSLEWPPLAGPQVYPTGRLDDYRDSPRPRNGERMPDEDER